MTRSFQGRQPGSPWTHTIGCACAQTCNSVEYAKTRCLAQSCASQLKACGPSCLMLIGMLRKAKHNDVVCSEDLAARPPFLRLRRNYPASPDASYVSQRAVHAVSVDPAARALATCLHGHNATITRCTRASLAESISVTSPSPRLPARASARRGRHCTALPPLPPLTSARRRTEAQGSERPRVAVLCHVQLLLDARTGGRIPSPAAAPWLGLRARTHGRLRRVHRPLPQHSGHCQACGPVRSVRVPRRLLPVGVVLSAAPAHPKPCDASVQLRQAA